METFPPDNVCICNVKIIHKKVRDDLAYLLLALNQPPKVAFYRQYCILSQQS